MSLIDKTYFVGDLNIPNTDKDFILERLNWFIEKYESQFLQDVLGYPLYKAFTVGLQQVSVDQRWTNILYGVEYTYSGMLRKYRGLLITPDALNPLAAAGISDINFTADASNESSGEYHNAALVGKTFRVVQRGVGPLENGVDITILSDGFGKIDMSAGEKFTIEFLQPVTIPAVGSTPDPSQQHRSAIACFVYWHWLKDQATQTVGLGEVATQAQNSTLVSPSVKMARAWNEMSRMLQELYYFLQANQDVYPEWVNNFLRWQTMGFSAPVNQFGI